MARKATPQETALQQALKKLRSIKANPQVLKGRGVIDTTSQMAVVPVPIAEFLTFIQTVEPIVVQRNDLYRLGHGLAKHLEEFALPQSVFGLVYLNSTFYIVDGNTRKRSWLSQTLRQLPSQVWVAVMAIDSQEEGERIYGCYDSKQAKKTNRDELMSMIHAAGLKPETLKSPVVAGGKLVSVVRNIARSMSGGSASPKRKQEVVNDHLFCFQELDRHGLDEGQVCGGALWAVLRLYRQLPREFFPYVDSYVTELKDLGTSQEYRVDASVIATRDETVRVCREDYGVGTSGEKPIPVMFQEYLAGFYRYARSKERAGRVDRKFKSFLAKLQREIITPELERSSRLLPQKG